MSYVCRCCRQWQNGTGSGLAAVVLSALSAVTFLITDRLTLLFVGRLLPGLSADVVTGTATAAIIELVPPKHRRELEALAGDPHRAREWLLEASMVTAVRETGIGT